LGGWPALRSSWMLAPMTLGVDPFFRGILFFARAFCAVWSGGGWYHNR
jgi:hypothetical protein